MRSTARLSTGRWVIRMNGFESDLKRGLCSKGFAASLIVEVFILFQAGFDSDLFRMSLPIAAAFPYAAAWLVEYESGFLKASLPRCGITPYIFGKFFACGICGGLPGTFGCLVYKIAREEAEEISLMLIFVSGMMWAVFSATLAAWSKSRYIAYGGAFVIYYLLIILYERYFGALYCLYPCEWVYPKHTWIFGDWGIVIMLSGVMFMLLAMYYRILRRCMERV